MTYKAKRRNLARTKSKRKASRGRRWGLVDEDLGVVLKSHGVSSGPFLPPYRSPLRFFRPTPKKFRVRDDTA